MARLSRGCNSCKAQRLRCGREQPTCKQCVKAGTKCEGSVPDGERFFVISAASNYEKPAPRAKKTLERNASPASSQASEESTTVTVRTASIDSTTIKSRTWLGRSLCESVDTLALGHYMTQNGDYSYIAADLLRPFDSFFTTEYKSQVSDHPSFKYASQALMLLDYSNTVGSSDVKTLAITQYGQALRSVQSCIDDPLTNVARFKSLLDSIWVMVQVEAKLHTKTSPVNCRTHMKGVFDIIRSTAPATMATYRAQTDQRRVLDGVKKLGASLDELTLLSLQTRQGVPRIGPWIESLMKIAGPPERLSLIASKIPALHAAADDIFIYHKQGGKDDLRMTLEDALAVDKEFLDWRYSLPEHWTTSRLQEPPWVKHEYLNLPVAILINQWRVWRIHVWMLALRCTTGAQDPFSVRCQAQANAELCRLAEGIFDSAGTYFQSATGDPRDSEPDPDIPSRFIRAAKLLALLLFAKRIPALPSSHLVWLDDQIEKLRPWASLEGVNRSFSTPFPVETGFLISLDTP